MAPVGLTAALTALQAAIGASPSVPAIAVLDGNPQFAAWPTMLPASAPAQLPRSGIALSPYRLDGLLGIREPRESALAALPAAMSASGSAPAIAIADGNPRFAARHTMPPASAPTQLPRSGIALSPYRLDGLPGIREPREPAALLKADSDAVLPFGSLSLQSSRPAPQPEFGLSAEWEPVPDTPLPAGFSTERRPLFPIPLSGSMAPVYASKRFSLNPVWLPALFAIANPRCGPRTGAWFDPGGMIPAPSGCADFWMSDGPGFSGLLARPAPSAVYWDFRETWSPGEEVEPDLESLQSKMPSVDSPWSALMRYWRSAPAIVRGLALAVPLIVPALFLGPKLSLPASTSSWNSFKGAVRARATVDLQDDFGAGLGAWTGKEGWAATWSLDAAGSARPGRLALLRESVPLADYHMEFLGQIESKAIGFAFRAMDKDNYYAAKLMMVKSGPLPALALVHYSVIGGQEGPRTQTPLIMTSRSDTIYRVAVTVRGDHFSVDVNGQYAGSWSDGRFKSGGVGFFSDKGEVSRIVWVHVVDKQDFLGWICSQVSQWTADRQTSGEKQE